VKPVDFTLHQPETLDEAVALLTEHGDEAKVLAGGQSLVPLLNFRLARPEHLIDLGRIASLTMIRRTSDFLTIGAMVRHAQAETSVSVRQDAPLMAAAFPHIAHQAIRARGTVGGSIAHGDPAAELPAVAVALEATMVAVGPGGSREIAASEFFISNLVTGLAHDEIMIEVRLPPAHGRFGAAFDEVARRKGDFALVGAGAHIAVAEDGTITDARICVTGVATTPYRAYEAETMLVGHRLDVDLVETAAEATRSAITPSGDLHASSDYRRDVAGTLITRVVHTAHERAAAALVPAS
jgi:aerobic carbon-monoxide dehydrogenase medium subunit